MGLPDWFRIQSEAAFTGVFMHMYVYNGAFLARFQLDKISEFEDLIGNLLC